MHILHKGPNRLYICMMCEICAFLSFSLVFASSSDAFITIRRQDNLCKNIFGAGDSSFFEFYGGGRSLVGPQSPPLASLNLTEPDIEHFYQAPYGHLWATEMDGTLLQLIEGQWNQSEGPVSLYYSAFSDDEIHILTSDLYKGDVRWFLYNGSLWEQLEYTTENRMFIVPYKGFFFTATDYLNVDSRHWEPYSFESESFLLTEAAYTKDGLYFIGVDGDNIALYHWNTERRQPERIYHSKGKTSDTPYIYSSAEGSLFIMGVANESNNPTVISNSPNIVNSTNCFPLYEDRNGRIWIANHSQIYLPISPGDPDIFDYYCYPSRLAYYENEKTFEVAGSPPAFYSFYPPPPNRQYRAPISMTGSQGNTVYFLDATPSAGNMRGCGFWRSDGTLYRHSGESGLEHWDLTPYINNIRNIHYVDPEGRIYLSFEVGVAVVNPEGAGVLLLGDDGHTCCYDPDDIGLCDGGCPDPGYTSDPAADDFSSRLWSTIVSFESCGESGTTGVSLNVGLPSEMLLVLDFDMQDDDTNSTDGDAGATLAPEGATYDVYLALVTPWQSVHFVESLPMRFSHAPAPTPLVASWTPFDIEDAILLEVELEEGLPEGEYGWHFALVESGGSLSDASGWIAHSSSVWTIAAPEDDQ